MKSSRIAATLVFGATIVLSALADERTMTMEQALQIIESGSADEEVYYQNTPKNLPDLTKGEDLPPPPKKGKRPVWNLGPTGIAVIMSGNFGGYQMLVQGTIKDSPADGKLLPGDVITGINGVAFKPGGHLGIKTGNAIIEAEREINKGKIVFNVWRDQNYVKRSGRQDVSSVDVDKLFEAAKDDNTLYDWKEEEERTQEVKQTSFDKFPIIPTEMDVELKLEVLPDYGDGLLEDCPKTKAIIEKACKVLEEKFVEVPGNSRSGRGGVIEAMALLSTGKPEYKKLVHQWVRSKHSPWRPPTETIGERFKPGYRGYNGYQTWHHGYNGLYCALYYEATKDEYVLPALRKYAIEAAMGQSQLGSWGHTFAFPKFNGGEFHKMNPGYGALNAAGNRCYFLVTLAQKLGIENPHIDLAVKRATQFFGSYTDQGCIPYGDHGAYGSDDSNGKNTGVAFSMMLLGEDYKAKYFARMSGHCAFTRRGGHAHDYHGNWSSWASNLNGPQLRAYQERNLRWRRTLSRTHTGRFIYHGGYGELRNETATQVLHQASIYKQLIITGKNIPDSYHMTDREMKRMFSSARKQFNDPALRAMDGVPWQERSTQEILEILDCFYPKARENFAKELGKRHLNGDKEVLPGILKLLESDNPRYIDGALRSLQNCGEDTILSNLSKVTPLLTDQPDFVQITASRTIAKGGQQKDKKAPLSIDRESQLAMLKATIEEEQTSEPNHLGNHTQGILFGSQGPLGNKPFDSGHDPDLVHKVLERLILLDPAGNSFMGAVNGKWDKDTIMRLAGPLIYAAEEEQIGDQMFANRSKPARGILEPLGYQETLLSTAYYLRKKSYILPHVRAGSTYKEPLCDPQAIRQNPAAFLEILPAMETALIDNPVLSFSIKNKSTNYKSVEVPLRILYPEIASKKDKPTQLPSMQADISKVFDSELKQLKGSGEQIKHCIKTLKDPQRRNVFRKLAAMDRLAELLGPDVAEILVPYLNHDYFRLRERSRLLAANAIKTGGADLLIQEFHPDHYPQNAIGILAAFALSGDSKGAKLAEKALATKHEQLRYQALHTMADIQKMNAVDALIAHLKSSAHELDQVGCQEALSKLAAGSKQSAAIRDRLIKELPELEIGDKGSAYMVLAKISDETCLNLLEKANATDSKTEFNLLAKALSYSPSRRADKILLKFALEDKKSAEVVGSHAVRRLVLGPKGFGDITDKERMDFVEPMIKLSMNKDLITYLATIYDARALSSLMFCLENGVADAVESLVSNAERAPQYSTEDSKVAAEALRNVIEYIEVTYLRGGPAGKDFRVYPKWKAMQARAGKALLKVHKPEAIPIPTFDPLEFE